jgi:hypothetical protein
MSEVRPALVDLALTKCTPGVAAYEATILDLAARGFLGVSRAPEGLRMTLAGQAAAGAGLAGFEQQVLGDVRTRLAGPGGAPFAALTEACRIDVDGTWNPFREKLVAEGRRLGICRKNLWARPAGILLLFLISILIASLVALAPRLIWHVSIGECVLIGVLSWFPVAKVLEALGQDVLTAAGAPSPPDGRASGPSWPRPGRRRRRASAPRKSGHRSRKPGAGSPPSQARSTTGSAHGSSTRHTSTGVSRSVTWSR